MPDNKIVSVAVDTSIIMADKAYDYLVPDSIEDADIGCRVLVPFGNGNKLTEAMIIDMCSESKYKKLKVINSLLDKEPVLSKADIKLAIYIRDKCFSTLYSVIKAMVPAGFWYKGKKTYVKAQNFDYKALLLKYSDDCGICALIERLNESENEFTAELISDIVGNRVTPSFISNLKDENVISEATTVKSLANDKNTKLYCLTDFGYENFNDGICTIKGSSQKKIAEFIFSVGKASQKEIAYYTDASPATIARMVKAGILTFENIEVLRGLVPQNAMEKHEIILNNDQQCVYDGLCEQYQKNEASAALLYGITGSGKTQVYIKLLENVIAGNKKGMILVPEIALTPQLLSIFYSQFNGRVAVIHSALSVGERYDEWRRIRRGDVDIVIGTRSAVFAPIPSLGIIIVDEEHEHTYISDTMPRYNALDVAKYKCHTANALLVLGSATPSIESAYAARIGKYSYYELNSRYGNAHLPQIIVSDTKTSYKNGQAGVLSPALCQLLTTAFSRGEQAILLVNRRGSGKCLICMDCGKILMCPNCSVSLKYHKANNRLICHQCGHSEKLITQCPVCASSHIESIGIGTQFVEEALEEQFPNVGVIRMDSDTTSGKNSHETLLRQFREKKAGVLIGTQMIAKGLDFENVTVCAVIDADSTLYCGDFRGSEQAFSMIMQLTGRAGRGTKPGTAVIQTATPNSFVIESASNHDYWGFYENEISVRRELLQPPFSKLITFTATGTIDEDVYQAARRLNYELLKIISSKKLSYDVLGPAPAGIHKLNNIYRYCVILRGQDSREMRDVVWEILLTSSKEKYGKSRIYADANT